MSVWRIILTVLLLLLVVILVVVFRFYHGTHSKDEEKKKIPSNPLEDTDEIIKKESFRQQLKTFLQKYLILQFLSIRVCHVRQTLPSNKDH